MNFDKRLTTTKIRKEDNEKYKQLCRELSLIERKNIQKPELFRRVINIPKLKDVLKIDADLVSKGLRRRPYEL